eukprot:6182376-Pleurochrysis_carterae.AAC.1
MCSVGVAVKYDADDVKRHGLLQLVMSRLGATGKAATKEINNNGTCTRLGQRFLLPSILSMMQESEEAPLARAASLQTYRTFKNEKIQHSINNEHYNML